MISGRSSGLEGHLAGLLLLLCCPIVDAYGAGSGDGPTPGPPDAVFPPRAVARVIGEAIPGRTVTLSYQGPVEAGVRLRWVQVEGPIVVIDDPTAAQARVIVPDAQGVLGFLLAVGNSAGIETTRVSVSIAPGPPRDSAPEPSLTTIGDALRRLMSGVPNASEVAEGLASAFDDCAARVDLYRCYDELFSELSRRLDGVVPREPATRAIWLERVFLPLTDRLADEIRPTGLDLRQPAGRAVALTEAQKRRLADTFHALARGASMKR